jgi:hypothetical protein
MSVGSERMPAPMRMSRNAARRLYYDLDGGRARSGLGAPIWAKAGLVRGPASRLHARRLRSRSAATRSLKFT